VEVAVVQIVGVALVADGHVTASGAMRVTVIGVLLTGHDVLVGDERDLRGLLRTALRGVKTIRRLVRGKR
jgi:hypothetical protein